MKNTILKKLEMCVVLCAMVISFTGCNAKNNDDMGNNEASNVTEVNTQKSNVETTKSQEDKIAETAQETTEDGTEQESDGELTEDGTEKEGDGESAEDVKDNTSTDDNEMQEEAKENFATTDRSGQEIEAPIEIEKPIVNIDEIDNNTTTDTTNKTKKTKEEIEKLNRDNAYKQYESMGYRYCSREEASRIINNYKNIQNIYIGREKIFYDGSPICEDLSCRKMTNYDVQDFVNNNLQTAIGSSESSYFTACILICAEREGHMSEMNYDSYYATRKKIENIAASLNYGSTYDKIRRAYDWVIDNCEYDDTCQYGSIYSLIERKTSVCAGYANTFQLMMEAMNIESYCYPAPSHLLNVVKLDGKFYFVDATWGDSKGTEAGDYYFLFGTDVRENGSRLNVSDERYDKDKNFHMYTKITILNGGEMEHIESGWRP